MSHTKTAELKKQIFARHHSGTRKAKHGPKAATIAAYSGVFLLVMSLVAIGYQPPQKTNNAASAVTTKPSSPVTVQPSVDQLVATRVAASIAERSNLPIASNVVNLSASLTAESQLAQTSTNVISKPQIVQPSANSREMKQYTAKTGDSIEKVAAQFGVSATTVKWANNLSSDALEPGRQLTIPPVDGVVYAVKAGDTVASIASKYKADTGRIVAFNDLELSGLTPDKKIVIPGGDLPLNERPGYVAPQPRIAAKSGVASTGYAVDPTLARSTAGNAYAYGYCTYWVFDRRMQLGRPVGSFWGNATTWSYYAKSAGYRVDSTPEVGAVYQMNAYIDSYTGVYGHVGVVESVNSDGSIYVSDMNYAGNFNRVTYRTIPAGTASQYTYIH